MRFIRLGILCALGAACAEEASPIAPVRAELTAPVGLDFGDVQVGLESTLEVELKNTGARAISLERFELGPAFTAETHEFAHDAAPTALAPAGSYKFRVIFRPLVVAERPYESWVRVITDASSAEGPIHRTIGLRGRAIMSGLSISPSPVDFGSVLVGSSKTLEVVITNRLGSAVEVSQAALSQLMGSGQFSIQAQLGRLEPGAALTAQVSYAPVAIEEDSARWEVKNCALALCAVHVELRGRGTDAAIACAPAALDFGALDPGASRALPITCTNAGDTPVAITGWGLEPGSSTAFIVDAAPSSTTLAPRATVSFDARFSPTTADLATRSHVGAVEVTALSATLSQLAPARVELRGLAGAPAITALPSPLSFGLVAVGGARARQLLITNEGFADLNVSGLVASDPQLVVASRAFSLQTGSSTVVAVAFAPTVAGALAAELTIASDDPLTPALRVPVTGQGVALGPCAWRVTPASVTFGVVNIGSSASEVVRVENSGTEDCLLSDVTLTPAQGPITLAGGFTDAVIVRPGESRDFTATFTPTANGDARAELGFVISDPRSPNNEVELFGVGGYPEGCVPDSMGLGAPSFPAIAGLPYANVGDNVNGWTPVPAHALWTTDGTQLINVGNHNFLPVSANSFTLEADVLVEDSISDLQFTLWDENYLLGYKMSFGPSGTDTPYFGLYKVFNDPARNVWGRPWGDDMAIFCADQGTCNPQGNPNEPEVGDLASVNTDSGGFPSYGQWFRFRYQKVGPTVTMSVNGQTPVSYTSPCLDTSWRLTLGSWAYVRVQNLTVQ